MAKLTISQMKAQNKAAGHNWFDKETMKFWGTTIVSAPDQWGMFIAKNTGFMNEDGPRYKLHIFVPSTGHVQTISQWQHNTLEETKTLRQAVAEGFAQMSNRECHIFKNLTSVHQWQDTPDGCIEFSSRNQDGELVSFVLHVTEEGKGRRIAQ